jgi:D-psicose/D-tagatose/L-ribulose 3-epimerase
MKRKIGVTTWSFGNIDLASVADIIAEIEFDGVELFVDIDSTPSQQTKKVFADQGLEIYSLTPGNVDLAANDSKSRNFALDYYKRLIDYSAELSCPTVTCHEYIQPQMDTCAGSKWLSGIKYKT